MAQISFESPEFSARIPVLIIGAGAAGLVAALAAEARGREVLLVERDSWPRGSTALSAGLIPAAGTRWQRALGITDDPALFAADILKKSGGEADPASVKLFARHAGRALEWLADYHGLEFSLVDNFQYPGHSALRMHGLASRSGAQLIERLLAACEARGIALLSSAKAETLFAAPDGPIMGIRVTRPDGSGEAIGCEALILACNGYGGNRDLVARHIPALKDALYFGHAGNQGEALLWGEALGAATRHLGGHQGHGSVASPQNILITWATISEGGFQVNVLGRRFSNESRGYSEQAIEVLAQPGGIAWSVFDKRIGAIARQFEDFKAAEAAGAILTAGSMDELAGLMRLDAAALNETLAAMAMARADGRPDAFGRDFSAMAPLAPPFCAVKVTGALFHTQGGLVVNDEARVMRTDKTAFPNLFAAGGAACGVSGSQASGYLSGNGLLSAIALGLIAGERA